MVPSVEPGWLAVIRRHPLPAFFLCAYGFSWVLWAPLWLAPLGLDGLPRLPYHHAWGALGPIAAAFLVSALVRGAAGPRELLARMVAWRGRRVWVGVAALGPLVLLLAATAAASLARGEPIPFAQLGRSSELPGLGVVGFMLYNIFTFGYGEEVGWRGFALPRLQARHTALGATVLLTLGWAVWHIPLFLYRPGYASMGLGGAAGWFLSLLTGAVLLTWFFNESRGSLLVVALFHASVDVAFTSDAVSPLAVNVAGVLITVWGIAVLVFAGPRRLSRREKVVEEDSEGTGARGGRAAGNE